MDEKSSLVYFYIFNSTLKIIKTSWYTTFYFLKLIIFIWPWHVTCGIPLHQGLTPSPLMWAWSLNHWITREVLRVFIFKGRVLLIWHTSNSRFRPTTPNLQNRCIWNSQFFRFQEAVFHNQTERSMQQNINSS